MKAFSLATFAFVVTVSAVTVSAVAQTRSTARNGLTHSSDKESLIGAWRVASIAGPDGKSVSVASPKGMVIYTRDGHMSVQLMYPRTANARSNEYVQDGYEASFGSYTIDEAAHTVTHHVQGSVTRDLLVGKDLPRVYRFSADRRLIIKSTRSDEHWSVTWEHY